MSYAPYCYNLCLGNVCDVKIQCAAVLVCFLKQDSACVNQHIGGIVSVGQSDVKRECFAVRNGIFARYINRKFTAAVGNRYAVRNRLEFCLKVYVAFNLRLKIVLVITCKPACKHISCLYGRFRLLRFAVVNYAFRMVHLTVNDIFNGVNIRSYAVHINQNVVCDVLCGECVNVSVFVRNKQYSVCIYLHIISVVVVCNRYCKGVAVAVIYRR